MVGNERGTKRPRVSIIIPTWDGYRDGCVPKLLESIEAQTFRDYELHLIEGVSPQGRAINEGAGRARGDILVIVDDDARLGDREVLERLVSVIDENPGVGMAGASIVAPPEANPFQVRAARQFPRFNMPVVQRLTDSDMACHGCCAIPRAVFEAVGGEREDIIRGLDPDLRVRLRNAGYRVVLTPNTRVFHPLPKGWRTLFRMFFRNGYGSAYAQKFRPDSVYDTSETVEAAAFQPKRRFAYRVLRFPLRIVRAVVEAKMMRAAAYCAYALGYAWGFAMAREDAMAPKAPGVET